MRLRSDDFNDMQPIPQEFAFGRPGDAGEPCVLADDRNPHLAWSQVPAQTRSFALTVIDADVPSVGDDVNKPDRRVPASLPRTEFVHWLMADIPADCHEIAAGSCANGVVARGRTAPAGPGRARQGVNDYTKWFAGDADMAGRSDLEPAADHGSLEHRHPGQAAELHGVENAVPHLGVMHYLGRVALAVLAAIEPGGEVVAGGAQQHRPHPGRRRSEEPPERLDGLVPNGVALVRPVQRQAGDGIVDGDGDIARGHGSDPEQEVVAKVLVLFHYLNK